MASSEKDTASGFPFPDDMTCRRCTQNTILADQKFLHAVCCAYLRNQLGDFGIVVSAISADDQEAPFYAFRYREEDAGNESLAVVGLLKDGDLFTKA